MCLKMAAVMMCTMTPPPRDISNMKITRYRRVKLIWLLFGENPPVGEATSSEWLLECAIILQGVFVCQ